VEKSIDVLVVSDDDQIRNEAGFAFPTGVEVVAVSDAREASVRMKTNVPDVLVVDIRTGSAGGFGLLRDMSQRATQHGIPVLMLLERAQDEWLARQAGATRIRLQPIEASDLVAETLSLIS
jgi:DNA-binding response OmpR family regulator